jgi:hypothetical protein
VKEEMKIKKSKDVMDIRLTARHRIITMNRKAAV